MKYSYEEYVHPYVNKFSLIEVDDEYVNEIKKLSFNIALKNVMTETNHKKDHGNELTRLRTGLIGEAALEKLLSISVIDWSVGDSEKYNKPDITGYSVGVKTVEWGKYPVIFKKNDYPQIICIKNKNDNKVLICGLATPDILNKYQDDELIISENLLKRGVKTGFYGFKHLIPIRSINDLQQYKIN